MIDAAEAMGETVGVPEACRTLGVPRSSPCRTRKPKKVLSARPAGQHKVQRTLQVRCTYGVRCALVVRLSAQHQR